MNVVIRIIKILVFLMTSFWGLMMGIFAPISIIFYDNLKNPELASHPIFWVWIGVSTIYIAACVLLMLNMGKISSLLSIIGFIGVLVVHGVIEGFRQTDSQMSASGLYLPNIFVTILILIATVMMNWDSINARLKASEDEKNAPAPSILAEDEIVTVEGKKKRK